MEIGQNREGEPLAYGDSKNINNISETWKQREIEIGKRKYTGCFELKYYSKESHFPNNRGTLLNTL